MKYLRIGKSNELSAHMNFLTYLLPLILLVIGELLFFRIARHYTIIDKPNDRSSHHQPTIRGGGIIFLLAVLLFWVLNKYELPYLVMALVTAGIVSFIDDIRSLPNWIKFSSHLIAVVLIFWQCGLLLSIPVLCLVAIGIIAIGVINAYNFMDGINGMTGLYSIAIVLPLLFTETNEVLRSLEVFILMGLVVFNFFNVRKRAICFAGDVGSISMATIIVFLLIVRIQETGFIYIGFLLVYAIDCIFTIVQRLFQKENIFKPHRKHLYQYLVNEMKIHHLKVSGIYAVVQLLINYGIVYGCLGYPGISIILILLIVVYWIVKSPFLFSPVYKK